MDYLNVPRSLKVGPTNDPSSNNPMLKGGGHTAITPLPFN